MKKNKSENKTKIIINYFLISSSYPSFLPQLCFLILLIKMLQCKKWKILICYCIL